MYLRRADTHRCRPCRHAAAVLHGGYQVVPMGQEQTATPLEAQA